MKIEIEQYKNQTIFYDDDSDKFTCDITVEEAYQSKTRKSLKEIRKEIDTFIKLNLEFKPFKCLYKDGYGDKGFTIVDIIAIRSDGKLVRKGGYSNDHLDKKDFPRICNYVPEIVSEMEKLANDDKEFRAEQRRLKDLLFDKLQQYDLSRYDAILNPTK